MSERSLQSAFKTELGKDSLNLALLFYGAFPSSDVRLWTGVGEIAWDSNTYSGAGNLISMSTVQEVADGSSQGITVTLSGIPSDTIDDVVNDSYQGNEAKIWLAALDSNGSVVTDPILIFGGQLDSDEILDDGKTASISIKCESRLVDLLKPRVYRYTGEDQKRLHPSTTDKGLEFVELIQDIKITWGGK